MMEQLPRDLELITAKVAITGNASSVDYKKYPVNMNNSTHRISPFVLLFQRRLRVPPRLVNATPSRTLCAVAVDVAPSTTRRRPALSAVTPLPSSALTTGARRVSAERPPVPVACATCPMSTVASRTVSVRAPRPRSRSRPSLLK